MIRNPRNVTFATGGRFGARRFVAAMAAVLLTLVIAADAAAQQVPAITVGGSDGQYRVNAAFSVPEAAAFAVAALTDYAQIPRFMPEVRSSNVLERDAARTIVEQEAVARFMMFSKRVHLVLEVREAQGTIRFRDRCGKSFDRYEGAWTIVEKDGLTQIVYELTAKPAFEVPEFLLKRLLKRDATQMIDRLKTEIAARSRRR